MGNQNSLDYGMKELLNEEFERVKEGSQKDYLNIQDIIKFQIPMEDYTFSFSHLGNLFVLNQKKDGKITIDDIYNFAEFCFKFLKNVQSYEFQSQLQAATIYKLWEALQNGQINSLVEWVGNLLTESYEQKFFNEYPYLPFLSMEAIVLMYDIFNVKMMNELEIQGFFDMLLQTGFEQGIDPNQNEELEEYISLNVVKEFTKQYFIGFTNLMKEIGFDQSQQLDYQQNEIQKQQINQQYRQQG
ncbi:hypothetical protein PPERSA_12430 [Pseudocohnilembus persalinus]|uniref:Uncharacterized protein n=1 Tax=Pseudocohnilembus persalinus TaxID=266149 RepID=A0A0V0QNS4_PSEPJ|nr:hypothetical protein PPERSA_12430 [Pseudocohnilembus persalinus]|eukprot:KRX03983.1 hypothetical protein PPERSA_12430 [Pseudocohnilembus persalinus]